jgi:hypothetical protein
MEAEQWEAKVIDRLAADIRTLTRRTTRRSSSDA